MQRSVGTIYLQSFKKGLSVADLVHEAPRDESPPLNVLHQVFEVKHSLKPLQGDVLRVL